jgi:hypothetical protein
MNKGASLVLSPTRHGAWPRGERPAPDASPIPFPEMPTQMSPRVSKLACSLLNNTSEECDHGKDNFWRNYR